ncbi:hypothetical protein Tco_1238726 [Tanacetum coccineum]
MLTERGDGVTSIKRRRHDLRSDSVSTLVTPSEHGRPKGTLEDSVFIYIFFVPFVRNQPTLLLTIMRDENSNPNPIHTLGDYFKPSHEGYRNPIELPVGNNVVPLRSDTIRLVQNGCSFHELRSEDPNQHLKDFLKLVDSLDLDGENRERTHMRLF